MPHGTFSLAFRYSNSFVKVVWLVYNHFTSQFHNFCVRILSIISLPCFTVVYPNSWLYVQRKDFLQHGLLICRCPWICCKNCCKLQKSATIPSSLVYNFPHVDVVSFHPICRLTMPVGTHWYQHTTLLCRPFSWQPQPEKGGEGVQSRRMKRKQPSRTSCESTMSTSCAFPHSVFKYSSWEEFWPFWPEET